jgi:hypothetical protein
MERPSFDILLFFNREKRVHESVSAHTEGILTVNRELFGDAIIWSGCALVYGLDEVDRFNAFDFCRYLTHVFASDSNDTV